MRAPYAVFTDHHRKRLSRSSLTVRKNSAIVSCDDVLHNRTNAILEYLDLCRLHPKCTVKVEASRRWKDGTGLVDVSLVVESALPTVGDAFEADIGLRIIDLCDNGTTTFILESIRRSESALETSQISTDGSSLLRVALADTRP